jgi:hypothetical protein
MPAPLSFIFNSYQSRCQPLHIAHYRKEFICEVCLVHSDNCILLLDNAFLPAFVIFLCGTSTRSETPELLQSPNLPIESVPAAVSSHGTQLLVCN